jgi:hypothetical protein
MCYKYVYTAVSRLREEHSDFRARSRILCPKRRCRWIVVRKETGRICVHATCRRRLIGRAQKQETKIEGA